MAFRAMVWNIEHFRGTTAARRQRVADHITAQNPDVFGLLEIENASMPQIMQNHFPGYDFAMTDGPQGMKILVGWRRGHFTQVAFTQKREFRAYNPYLRPGALWSGNDGGDFYHLLYLHTDSGTEAKDFGNRYEMFEHIWKLKKALDDAVAGNASANLIIMGDLNTMGMRWPYRYAHQERVGGAEEVQALDGWANRVDMSLLDEDSRLDLQQRQPHFRPRSRDRLRRHHLPRSRPERGWRQCARRCRGVESARWAGPTIVHRQCQ